MSTAAKTIEKLNNAIKNAFKTAIDEGLLPEAEIPSFHIEIPADSSHGDLAANAAMVSAKAFRTAPRKIAEIITSKLDLTDTDISRFEIAGPGFINFFYSSSFYGKVIEEINTKGSEYGKSDYGKGKKVLVEFVSANPTGPMHIGNARGGAIGDSLSSVLDAAGYEVAREF